LLQVHWHTLPENIFFHYYHTLFAINLQLF